MAQPQSCQAENRGTAARDQVGAEASGITQSLSGSGQQTSPRVSQFGVKGSFPGCRIRLDRGLLRGPLRPELHFDPGLLLLEPSSFHCQALLQFLHPGFGLGPVLLVGLGQLRLPLPDQFLDLVLPIALEPEDLVSLLLGQFLDLRLVIGNCSGQLLSSPLVSSLELISSAVRTLGRMVDWESSKSQITARRRPSACSEYPATRTGSLPLTARATLLTSPPNGNSRCSAY